MKTVLKRALQIILSLQLVVCLEPVVAFGSVLPFDAATISNSADNNIEDGVLICNSKNVACLAQTEYEVVSTGDEMMTVTVPATEWSLAAMNTSLSYVAFSRSGTKLDVTSDELGTIELNNSSDVVILKNVTAVVSLDGRSVRFSGYELGVEDYQLAFSALGPVGGRIDSLEERAAFQAIEPVLPEGAEAALVDMPELNSRAAQIWASCYHGDTLAMYEYGLESDGEYPTASFTMNIENYMGYYPAISPLGGEGGDFLDARFLDSWAVDAEGYLWYVDSVGKQYFYGTSFFAVAENAINVIAVTQIQAVDEEAAKEMAPELRNLSSDPCVAVAFKGFTGTLYYSSEINEVTYSLGESTLSFDSTESMRLSFSYGLARDTKLYYNFCLNPDVPVSLQAGPVSVDVYLSIGISLDTAKFSFSFERTQRKKTTVNLMTGASTAEEISNEAPSFAIGGGFSGEVKCFSSIVLGLGKRITGLNAQISLASVDAGIGLEVSAVGDMTSGCGDLKGELYPYLQAPSIYDDEKIAVPKTNGHPGFASALKKLLRDASVYSEPFGRLCVFDVHVERGLRVEACTKTASYKIIADGVSLVDGTGLEYTGDLIEPTVVVKCGSVQLTMGTDYSVSYSNNINVGTACVTVRGKGKTIGRVMKTFVIDAASIGDAEFGELGIYYFTGQEIKPVPTVTLKGRTLDKGRDYDLTYSDNIDYGFGFVEVTGKGNYSGSALKMFKIAIYHPAFESMVTSFAKKVTVSVKLTSKPEAAVAKARICVAKTKAAALKWNDAVTKTVNLAKIGDSVTLSVKDLNASTSYYVAIDLGIKTPSGVYWRSEVKKGSVYSFTTKSSKSGVVEEDGVDADAIVLTEYAEQVSEVRDEQA